MAMCDEKLELSVIIPVYNVEKYIGRCLQSVLDQTYYVGQIVCVDDGSTDSSLEILEKFREKDQRIKILHKQNGGLISAKKEGLLNVESKYVTFVDADDWIESNMYQELMELLTRSNADIVTSGCIRDYGNYCVVEQEGIVPQTYDGEKLQKELLMKMISTNDFYHSNISIHHWNKIYRYDLLFECLFKLDDDINIGEDAALVYPCLLNAARIAVSGKSYYHYCLRDNSMMSIKDSLEQHRKLFEGLRAECRHHVAKVPNIMEQMRFFEYYVLMLQHPECVMDYEEGLLFPYGRIPKEAKVVIYGAGRFGKALKFFLDQKGCFRVIAWIDKKRSEGEVVPPDKLDTIDYDIILVGVLISSLAVQIKQELMKQGVDENKIFLVDCSMLRKEEEMPNERI